jgi:hypothetical protein
VKDGRGDTASAYDRGELTVARFNDSCRDCDHSRPSGTSFLCEIKEMRVFADATCSSFEPRDAGKPFATLAIRRALYHANLTIEMAIEQHMELQARVAAANAGRVG